MRALTMAFLASLLAFVGRARAEPARQGAYGGLALAGSLEPFGANNELQRGCTDLGAAVCSTPVPFGGGMFGYAGGMVGTVGLEIMAGGFMDYTRPSATFDGVPHKPHGNPLVSTPRREETFIILRGGAVLAPRARVWVDAGRVAWSFAGGVGLSYRYMALEREVTTDGALEDRPYFSHGTPYISPGLSLDASAQIRSTPTLALSIGLGLWAETAWGSTRAVADPTRTLQGSGKVEPVATPPYLMAYGLQLLLLPYLGLAFGP